VDIILTLAQGLGFLVLGLIGFILIAWVFGETDTTIWEYESEGYCEFSLDKKLEVEFTKSKSKRVDTKIMLSCRLVEDLQNKDISVLLNGSTITQLTPIDANTHVFTKAVSLSEPSAGDRVSIIIDEKEIYTSRLICDF